MDAYLHGPSLTPLLGETIGANLRRTVERHGERDAIVVRSQAYRATYRQLWDATTTLARALLARRCSRAIASASGRRTALNGW
jgi:fatty-acyl-CoA synthase